MSKLHLGYTRISTAEMTSIPQHCDRLKRAGCDEVLFDVESGRNDDRVEFQKLMAWCREGKVWKVTVPDLDRLGRNAITLLQAFQTFEDCGIQFESLLDPVPTDDSTLGFFVRGIKALWAEAESRHTQRRIKERFAYVRRHGLASSKRPFGYARDEEGRYCLDDRPYNGIPTWQVARAMVDLYLTESTSIRHARILILERYGKSWTANGFRNWLLNPLLRGHIRYGVNKHFLKPDEACTLYNVAPPLISQSEYELIQRKLNQGKRLYGANRDGRKPYVAHLPLGDQMVCGECGGKVYFVTNHSLKRKYARCNTHSHFPEKCGQRIGVREEAAIAATIAAIQERAETLADMALAEEDKPTAEMLEVLSELEQLKQIPRPSRAIAVAIADLESQLANLKAEQKSTLPDRSERQELVKLFRDDERWVGLNDEDLRQVFLTLVDVVVVRDGEVKEVRLRI